MTTHSTVSSAQAWSPDRVSYVSGDVVPNALILLASTVVGQIEGDSPTLRVPWAEDDDANFVAEGSPIPDADPALKEVEISTGRVSQLISVSNEQWRQDATASLLSESAARAVTVAANSAFINEDSSKLKGLLSVAGTIDGGTISSNLDPLASTMAEIETNGGHPSIIIANPTAWGNLRQLKTGAGHNTALLGAGTDDQEKRLLGVPVVTSPAVQTGKLIVVDRSAVLSAVSPIDVAQSEHLLFASYSMALRVTWRIGWAVQHANRLAILEVDLTAAG